MKLSLSQQKHFLELVYDHQSVFSLCDEDLGLCDQLKHTIPTTTNKSVYLPHHTIPVQLQTEVRKCLDTWLKQGIICPSHSPYMSQVVICDPVGNGDQMLILGSPGNHYYTGYMFDFNVK